MGMLDVMRGEPDGDEPSGEDDADGDEGAPTAEELSAAERLCVALGVKMTPEKGRAIVAALKDIC